MFYKISYIFVFGPFDKSWPERDELNHMINIMFLFFSYCYGIFFNLLKTDLYNLAYTH